MGSIIEQNQNGQTLVEYLVMVATITSFFVLVTSSLAKLGVGNLITQMLTTPFAMTYKYGDPQARGPDEGTPQHHPRIFGGPSNFRIFANPKF